MFGLGFGELLVVLIVAVVVLGPKDLPRYMRKAGETAARLRRLAFEMREKSGIDEVLRTEGLDRDIAEIRRLARGEINGVMAAVRSTTDSLRTEASAVAAATSGAIGAKGTNGPSAATTMDVPMAAAVPASPPASSLFTSDREYPAECADAYGALPTMANVYGGDLPQSGLATDPVYARGEEQASGPSPFEAPR